VRYSMNRERSLVEKTVRSRREWSTCEARVTRKSPHGVLVNESGPCARSSGGPHITAMVRIERKMSARGVETSAGVILSVCATQAIKNGPILVENVRTRNDRDQNSFMSPSESDR